MSSPKQKVGSPKPGAALAATPDSSEDILPPSHWAIVAAVEDDDTESNIGSDVGSSTASLTSSLLRYRTVNGRRYHAEHGNASYWASNDEVQIESMDLYAHLCRLIIDNKLHKAPLEKDTLKTAVDIGTGTGTWAIDFADEYPECDVIGTDITPIQHRWVPPNLRFEIEDCTQEWTFRDNQFDYVHMRLLYGSISDWDALFDEAYRVCKPGGWIESQEASPAMECDDGSVPPTSAIAQWGKFFFKGGDRIGRTFRIIQEDLQIKAMKRLGMEDIQVQDLKPPLAPWPTDPVLKEVGYVGEAVLDDLEGYLTYMASLVENWTKDEISVYCSQLRRELRDPKHHTYFRQRVVWARKPLNATEA